MVLGAEGQDWDHSDGKGDVLLPTLGLSVPLYPGDVLVFFASLLPHQVKLLPEVDRHKRTVVTLFTCASTQDHLEYVGHAPPKKRKQMRPREKPRKKGKEKAVEHKGGGSPSGVVGRELPSDGDLLEGSD